MRSTLPVGGGRSPLSFGGSTLETMRKIKIALIQIVLALAAVGLFAGFIELKQQPGNIVDFSIGDIAVVDSIILTVLISGAFTCGGTALMMFKSYFED